jgi:hypothetical protein
VQVAVAAGSLSNGATGSADESEARIPRIAGFDRQSALHPGHFDQSTIRRSALKAGALGGLVGVLSPLLGILVAGAFAVFFYRRQKGFVPPVSVGSRAAAAAGVIPYTLSYLLSVIRIFAFHHQQEYTDQFVKLWQMLGFNPSDPDIQAGIHFALTPSGIAMGFFLGMILAVALAAGAGALAALFGRQPRI